ncbi:hypothetical protein ID866_8143 [Astraeus odoratus]|nr:hypothetical protein ID866_8143 [Astraeus odoratus]
MSSGNKNVESMNWQEVPKTKLGWDEANPEDVTYPVSAHLWYCCLAHLFILHTNIGPPIPLSGSVVPSVIVFLGPLAIPDIYATLAHLSYITDGPMLALMSWS